jgi:hypothetical protein
MVHNEAENR